MTEKTELAKYTSRRVRTGKAKGRRLQKYVAGKISEMTGISMGKDRDIESREMGQAGVDIKLYGKAKELFPYAIECKNAQNWSFKGYIKQARDNNTDGWDNWLLFVGKNHFKPIVLMEADLFFELFNGIELYEKTLKSKVQWSVAKNVIAARKKIKDNLFIFHCMNDKEERFAIMDADLFFKLYAERIIK